MKLMKHMVSPCYCCCSRLLGWYTGSSHRHIRLTGSSEPSLQDLSVRIFVGCFSGSSHGLCDRVTNRKPGQGKTQPSPQDGWDRLLRTCDSECRSSADEMACGQSQPQRSCCPSDSEGKCKKLMDYWTYCCMFTSCTLSCDPTSYRTSCRLEELHFCFKQICRRKEKKKQLITKKKPQRFLLMRV